MTADLRNLKHDINVVNNESSFSAKFLNPKSWKPCWPIRETNFAIDMSHIADNIMACFAMRPD